LGKLKFSDDEEGDLNCSSVLLFKIYD